MKRIIRKNFLNIFLAIIVVNCFILAKPISAQYLFQLLIYDYQVAVERGDPIDIEEAWNSLKRNQTAIDYMKANLPDLFESFQKGNEGQFAEARTVKSSDSFTVEKEAKEFPNQDLSDNRSILESEPNIGRWDNHRIATSFPNQNRPDNRELIKQRKRQDRGIEMINSFDDYLKDDSVIVSISGVDDSERKPIVDYLRNDFKSIVSIEEVGFDNGVIYLIVVIDMNAKQFSERLEGRDFKTFELDLVRFRGNRIDYVFKSL